MGRKFTISFAEYHIKNTDPNFIEKYWSDKNTVNPFEIGFKSEEKIWILCQEKDYHNDEGGYETTPDNFTRGRRCSYCAGKKLHRKDSFAQLGIDKYGDDFLDKYWSDKNTLDPWNIKRGSSEYIYIKCQNKSYHQDYEIRVYNFMSGKGCPYCKGQYKVNYFDSLGFLHHKIAKMVVNDKRNNLTWEDVYSIAPRSNKKYYVTCLECGTPRENKISINELVDNDGFSCKICRNGFSTAERFASKLLNYLGIDFITQLNRSYFEWCKNYRYDIYIPKFNMIIELHGRQHYEHPHKGSYFKSLEYEINNDKNKKELALKNNISYYIVIDCRESTFRWISNNIINSLKDFIDFNSVDMYDIWTECQKSLVVESWKMLDDGIDKKTICEKLHISKNTLKNYEKRRLK